MTMVKYVTLGAHDLKAAQNLYDKVMPLIGLKRQETREMGIGYGREKGHTDVWVMQPHNKLPATFGNGTMIALEVPTRKALDEFHATALKAGGFDEGKPGIRGGADCNWYACCVRDLTGNKLSVICDKPQK
jgi:catechol-2,3-dioxygenase